MATHTCVIYIFFTWAKISLNMATILKFRGAWSYNPKNMKTIGDKPKLINDMTSQYTCASLKST